MRRIIIWYGRSVNVSNQGQHGVNMKMSELLPMYLEYRAVTQGRTANTLRVDRAGVEALIDGIGDIDPRNIQGKHVDLLVHRISRGSVATFNIRLASSRSFMLWCRRRGHVGKDFDPLGEIMYRKPSNPERTRLSPSKFFPLLDAAGHPRDRILAAIGLWTFMRVSEIRHLRVKDVNLEAGELSVYVQKTNEYDVMPISKTLDTELRRWLTEYVERSTTHCEHPECGPLCGEWFLVPAKTSSTFRDNHRYANNPNAALLPTKPLGDAPERIIKEMLSRVGFVTPDREGTHTLRRSGARAYFDALVDSGFDGALKRVSSMLHHSSVTMTERYLGIREDRHTRNRDIRASVMFPGIEGEAASSVAQLKAI